MSNVFQMWWQQCRIQSRVHTGSNEWICFQDCASLRLILCYCWADQTKAAWLSAPRSKARYNALARGAPDVGAHPHQLPCQCEFRSLKWKAGNAPKGWISSHFQRLPDSPVFKAWSSASTLTAWRASSAEWCASLPCCGLYSLYFCNIKYWW